MNASKQRQKGIKRIEDSGIGLSDIPELDDTFWRRAKLVMPEPKRAVSLRVDPDVLDWFKAQGKGYQSLINAVLRSYKKAMSIRKD